MLHAKENATYTYVFIKIVPAFTIIISTVIGNNVAIGKPPKKIVSKTAYIALALTAAQARSSLIDPMAV
jgi:hypothetical protein